MANCLYRAAKAGLTWPLPFELDEGTLAPRPHALRAARPNRLRFTVFTLAGLIRARAHLARLAQALPAG